MRRFAPQLPTLKNPQKNGCKVVRIGAVDVEPLNHVSFAACGAERDELR
jgi:hypothetical protein